MGEPLMQIERMVIDYRGGIRVVGRLSFLDYCDEQSHFKNSPVFEPDSDHNITLGEEHELIKCLECLATDPDVLSVTIARDAWID